MIIANVALDGLKPVLLSCTCIFSKYIKFILTTIFILVQIRVVFYLQLILKHRKKKKEHELKKNKNAVSGINLVRKYNDMSKEKAWRIYLIGHDKECT